MDSQFAEIGEALRRRAMGSQQADTAGIPGGAEATTNVGSPVAQAGMSPMQQATGGMTPDAGMVSGQTKALEQALPQEANIILKSLTKTLDRLVNPQQA